MEKKQTDYEYDLNNNKVKYNNKTTYILIAILVVVFLGGLTYFLVQNNYLEFNVGHIDNSKVELQYTETNNKVKEGIYITDVSDVVEEAMPSIVAITSKTLVSSGNFGWWYSNKEQYSEGAGSGIIVSKSDTELLILTNNHVVEGTSELTVTFINDKTIDAKIKGTSEKKDIAIISVKLNDLDKNTLSEIKLATVGDSTELKVGNGVIAIGNALGYGQSVTTGVVSALNREVEIDNYSNSMIQIDAAINGGNSGGALLNSKGEVVGINSAKYSSNGSSMEASIEGMGFAIPITDVKDLITTLMNGEEEPSAPVLGISGYMTNEGYNSYYNLPVGFYISDITKDSGADKAGLEIGNIITKIGNKEVTKLTDISNYLSKKKVGDEVELTIKYPKGRQYEEKKIKVTLS